MIELNLTGANRIVILTRRYAIKLPRAGSVRALLYGLLNNMNEARDGKLPGRCPVLFSLPFGLLTVMPRAAGVTAWDSDEARRLCERNRIRAELKPESFGIVAGKLVATDYGWEMP